MDEPVVIPLIDAVAKLRPDSSRTRLRELLSRGQVRVNGSVVKIGRLPIAPDDRVEIGPVVEPPPVRAPLPIVYEDEDLLVIDKPAGVLTSTVPSERRPTALAMMRHYVHDTRPKARVGLIHRLDRDASGLLVFSLNETAYDSLKAQFYDHSAGRIYAAVVDGAIDPPAGTIKSRLVEYIDGTVHLTKQPTKGDEAITHYQTMKSHAGRSLVRVSLETGRKHQIRAHFAELGFPIVGDDTYHGSLESRLMLAGIELHVTHPTSGDRLKLQVDLPAPLAKLMR